MYQWVCIRKSDFCYMQFFFWVRQKLPFPHLEKYDLEAYIISLKKQIRQENKQPRLQYFLRLPKILRKRLSFSCKKTFIIEIKVLAFFIVHHRISRDLNLNTGTVVHILKKHTAKCLSSYPVQTSTSRFKKTKYLLLVYWLMDLIPEYSIKINTHYWNTEYLFRVHRAT